MLNNIPEELRERPQWVVAYKNKEPINPRTGRSASPTDSTTWATFEEAVQVGAMHVGFVLTDEDPYSIIDLDAPFTDEQKARHQRILSVFPSYTEVSQSGQGLHIVVRGSIPHGTRRDRVELYSSQRYMIFTGRVLKNLPVTDQQETLTMLFEEMQSTAERTLLVEEDEVYTDATIVERAINATNGDKFTALCNGDLSGYPSQSEADFALLTILCFYSKSNQQVRRLFRFSNLGKRDKAVRNNDYIDRCLEKIRQRQHVPLVDLTPFLQQEVPPALPPPLPPVRIQEPPALPIMSPHRTSVPPGLIGEFAEYIYGSAIRPVREISLVAALGLGAGMFGRQFNYSSTGLNQFLIVLAKTGTGKEGAAGGIDALISSIRGVVPEADNFIGPGTFASGQALTRSLDANPCFVSILGEVGLTLQQICDKNAGPHNVQLRKVLLDIYLKSGWTKTLRASVYSDREKNTEIVRAPNVTILGESTPSTFYGALDSAHISEGLIPRFLVVEYEGDRPPPNPQAFHSPNSGLISRLTYAAQTVVTMARNDACHLVRTDTYAAKLLADYSDFADSKINDSGDDEVSRQLWTRAHLKALKLSGLIAVGCSLQDPCVTREIAEWSIHLVDRDVANMTTKFSSGAVGHGDHQQEHDIRAACDRYPTMSQKQRATYKVPKLLLDKEQLIPYVFLKRYLAMRASFKNDRRGAVVAVQTALTDMERSGMLKRISPEQAKNELGVDSPVYIRGESW
jgi:hypothetical protein